MSFIQFWARLNAALTVRGEHEALFPEAHDWWDWRPIKQIDDRLINRVINARKAL